MKALVYDKAHSLEDFAIKLAEIPEPTLREFDVLVEDSSWRMFTDFCVERDRSRMILFDHRSRFASGIICMTHIHALLANERMTNSGSAAMTIRSARAAASGWRRPDSQ